MPEHFLVITPGGSFVGTLLWRATQGLYRLYSGDEPLGDYCLGQVAREITDYRWIPIQERRTA